MFNRQLRCEGLEKDNCILLNYCGWCRSTNQSDWNCVDLDVCSQNITGVCVTDQRKIDCIGESILMFFLIFSVYSVSIFYISESIKKIITNTLLNKNKDKNSYSDKNEFTESSHLINENSSDKKNNLFDKDDLIDENDFNYQLKKKIENICYNIALIIYILLGISLIIVYFADMVMFFVEIFFIILFVIILGFITYSC